MIEIKTEESDKYSLEQLREKGLNVVNINMKKKDGIVCELIQDETGYKYKKFTD